MPGVVGILAPILWRVEGTGTSFLSDTSGGGDPAGETGNAVGAGVGMDDDGDDDGLLADAEVGADTGEFEDDDGEML